MRTVFRPQHLEWNVFTRREALRAGITDRQLGGPAWQRLIRGVYADSRMKLDHGLRVRAALRILPRSVAIAGPSAAWHYGCKFASPDEPVHILVSRNETLGPMQRIRVHTSHRTILPGDLVRTDGVRMTSPLRTAWDIGCWLPFWQSVPYLDLMLKDASIPMEGLSQSVRDRPSIRGSHRAFTAIQIADARAESFAESSLRAQLHTAGILRPEVQHTIRANDELVARVDLAWPDKLVALEYEGSYHAAASQMPADRARLSRIAAAGWRVVFATGRHVYGNAFPELVETLRSMLK